MTMIAARDYLATFLVHTANAKKTLHIEFLRNLAQVRHATFPNRHMDVSQTRTAVILMLNAAIIFAVLSARSFPPQHRLQSNQP